MAENPFKDFELHDTWFDWSDPSLTAESIGRKLMGSVAYWNHEDFSEIIDDDGEILREAMAPQEIEREILFEAGRDNWGLTSPYGKPYYQHMLTLMALLDEETDITPTIADATYFFCISLTAGLSVLNLIGSQNAGKSAGSVRIAMACLYIDTEYCQVFVANPFDNSAESTIWGEVKEMWQNICRTHSLDGDDSKTSLFPEGYLYRDQTITAIPNEAKGARIELRNVKKAGKFKGSKTRGKNTDRGIILVLIDEINEIDSHAFLDVLPNLSSQEGFFCITSQNFKDEEDLGGRICEPAPRYEGSKSSYNDLHVDDDQFWPSKYDSTTLRFDGARSANMLAKRTIYPYLFKQKDWDRLLELGEDSPDFFSQARSFPVRGVESNSVLPRSTVSNSRHDDPYYTKFGPWVTVSFSDPAFGGKDAAKWGAAAFGMAMVKDGNGRDHPTMILEILDYFKKLRITKDAVWNDFWFDRLRALGLSTSELLEGAEVSEDDQVAIQCAEFNRLHGIPSNCFGYDFSMRPHIVSSMGRVMSNPVAYEYNRGPEGYHIDSLKGDSVDHCHDRVSELAFLAADLFVTRRIRGGDRCATATMQLGRTKYARQGKKRKVENKKEYKKRWQQQSPDDRDVLLGLVGMAYQKGMSQKRVKATNSSSSDKSKKIYSKFTKAKVKKI